MIYISCSELVLFSHMTSHSLIVTQSLFKKKKTKKPQDPEFEEYPSGYKEATFLCTGFVKIIFPQMEIVKSNSWIFKESQQQH